MTDNRTTGLTAMEHFRALLKERGIEFETEDNGKTTVFEAALGDDFFATVEVKNWYANGELTPWLEVEFLHALTPEQAIAATLGSEREKQLESFVLDMLFAIKLGSMSDLTDRSVLKSWLKDFSERASELGIEVINE